MAETMVTAAPPAAPVTETPSPVSPTAAPSPAPAPVSPVSPAAPDWRATLPDDLKAHKGLEKFKDVGSLAKSYVAMESYQGRSVAIPGPDAKPEEKAAFYQKLGVPDAPEKYAIAAPAGAELDAGAVKSWQGVFHRLNLTPDQVAGLTSEFFGSPMGNPTAATDALKGHAETSLKAEWGGAYQHNLRTAQEAVRLTDRQSGAGLLAVLESTGLGNHPAVIKHFHWLGKTFAESGDLPREALSGDVMNPDSAKQQIATIMADRTHAYWRGDRQAVQEMARLHELAAAAA